MFPFELSIFLSPLIYPQCSAMNIISFYFIWHIEFKFPFSVVRLLFTVFMISDLMFSTLIFSHIQIESNFSIVCFILPVSQIFRSQKVITWTVEKISSIRTCTSYCWMMWQHKVQLLITFVEVLGLFSCHCHMMWIGFPTLGIITKVDVNESVCWFKITSNTGLRASNEITFDWHLIRLYSSVALAVLYRLWANSHQYINFSGTFYEWFGVLCNSFYQ